jgi:hypothetical protein
MHEANVGQQFIRVYRGLHATSSVNTDQLGKYWSSDRKVAELFAGGFDDISQAKFPVTGSGPNYGHVVTATVHPDHVVIPGSKEHREMVEDGDLPNPTSSMAKAEKEVTLKHGAPVKIESIDKVTVGNQGSVLSQKVKGTPTEGNVWKA